MNSHENYQTKSAATRKAQSRTAQRHTGYFLLAALTLLAALLVLPADSYAQSVLSDDAYVSFSAAKRCTRRDRHF